MKLKRNKEPKQKQQTKKNNNKNLVMEAIVCCEAKRVTHLVHTPLIVSGHWFELWFGSRLLVSARPPLMG